MVSMRDCRRGPRLLPWCVASEKSFSISSSLMRPFLEWLFRCLLRFASSLPHTGQSRLAWCCRFVLVLSVCTVTVCLYQHPPRVAFFLGLVARMVLMVFCPVGFLFSGGCRRRCPRCGRCHRWLPQRMADKMGPHLRGKTLRWHRPVVDAVACSTGAVAARTPPAILLSGTARVIWLRTRHVD